MHTKTCLKCNHTAAYEAAAPQACPSCSAIYSKVEAALRNAAPPRPRPATPQQRQHTSAASTPDTHAFAAQLRAQSLYPAWRTIVGLLAAAGYIVAALVLVGALVSTGGSLLGALAGAGAAAFIAIFAKVGKELSLMMADLSDAAVHLAAQSRRPE